MKPKASTLCLLSLLVMFIACSPRPVAAETVLLSDNFKNAGRSTPSLPNSAQWFYSGQATAAARLWVTPPAATGQLRMVSAAASAMALAYFTPSGSPRTLAAGESIEVNLMVKVDSLTNSDSDVIIGLFNSAGSRPTADVESGSAYPPNTTTLPYTNTHSGYLVGINTGAPGADSFNVFERNNQGSNMPFASLTRLGTTDNQATLNLKVKQSFPMKLKISRSAGTGASVTVSATVNGVTVTQTDSSALLTSFDCFGLYINGSAVGSGQAVTVDDVIVQHTSAAAVVTSLMNDSFTDNERATQALPASARWFYNGSSTASARLTCAAPVSTSSMVLTPGGQDAMALAYFTAANSPKTLMVGESITFQTNLRLDLLQNANEGIRFGLFNSGNVRVSADNEAGTNSTTYDGYRGYSVWLTPGGNGNFNIYLRGGGVSGQNPFTSDTSTLIGSTNTADLALSTSPVMVPRFSMTITRLSSGMQIDASINGRTVVRTETAASPTATAFDTAAVFFTGAALYEGPQAVFDAVQVIHSGVIPPVASLGKIFSEPFDGTVWSATSFTQATGSIASGLYGTINVLGGVTPSTGMKLNVDSSAVATGFWSGSMSSGAISATNAETDKGKLTLAFDLQASSVRPVRVRLQSTDSTGATIGGTLEKLIYPAVPGSFQRFVIELSDITQTSGTFSTTSGFVKLTFQIEGTAGGSDANSWPTGTHSLQIDNVYYARPAFYVKPSGGSNINSGRTEALAFATIAKALSVADDGDIVLVMATKPTTDSTYDPTSIDYHLTGGLSFSRGGVPSGWVTIKNYPGHRPLIQRDQPVGDQESYDTITLQKGTGTTEDTTTNLNYIEVRGLRVRGTADTLPVADRGGSTAKSNLNGFSIAGRYMAICPHHVRFADNEIFNFSAAGLGGGDTDSFYVENNDIHDNSNWTIYATSGISVGVPFNFVGTAGTYRIFLLGNRSYRNETKEKWVSIDAISDGNGAILDTFLNTRHGPYLGRAIVANNLLYENGGSGCHTLNVNGADIINNTVVRNSHSPALKYANLFTQESNDIVIANNVVVASTGEAINGAGYTTSYPRTTGVRFLNNVYLSDGSTNTPYPPANSSTAATAADYVIASGNVTTTDVKFVNDAVGTNDYRLKTGSPAFDAGISNTGLAALGVPAVLPIRDNLGILRNTDGTPDVGAFVRQPAIVTGPLSQTVTVGGNVTFSVTAQSGGTSGTSSVLTYQWQRNGVNIAGATSATLTLTAVTSASAGTYHAAVSVGGATPFDTVTSSDAALSVQKATTAAALVASSNPTTYGAPVTFTATVTGGAIIPTGTVNFSDGGVSLGTGTLDGAGVATFSSSTLIVGSHTVTATYGGSSDHLTSTSSPLTQTILIRASATALASGANPAVFGASVTFTATVTSAAGMPSGTVTFLDGAAALGTGTLNGSGVATFATNALTTGSHAISASYGGTGNHSASVSPALTQTVQSIFDGWRADNFTPAQLAAPGVSGAGADPDGDGFSNLLEFAFGTNPDSATSGPGAINYNGAAAITLRAQPTVSIANTGTGVDYRVVFGRRKNWVAAGLLYVVQFSANMTTWEASANNPPNTVATDAEMDAVTVPYPFFLSTGEKAQFFRVVVTLP